MASEAKPSLHEIAAMPFPSSVKAMREHYNRDWGRELPDGVTEKRKFSVRVQYSYEVRETETVEVEAWTEEEAEELACDQVEQLSDAPFDADFDIIDCKVSEVADA